MIERKAILLMALGVSILGSQSAWGEEDKADARETERRAEPWTLHELLPETSHEVTVDGRSLAPRATAGTLILEEEDGNQKASLFFTAYTLDDVSEPSQRPLP